MSLLTIFALKSTILLLFSNFSKWIFCLLLVIYYKRNLSLSLGGNFCKILWREITYQFETIQENISNKKIKVDRYFRKIKSFFLCLDF